MVVMYITDRRRSFKLNRRDTEEIRYFRAESRLVDNIAVSKPKIQT